jgi:hypothetical protein
MTQAADTDHESFVWPTCNWSRRAEPGEVNPVGINFDSSSPRAKNSPAKRPLLVGDGH